jgi:drug/metabolite transporter (DMT)-like permease
MSAPYEKTVYSGNRVDRAALTNRQGGDRRALLMAVLGAGTISCSAIYITLAHTGYATAAFYRCMLAIPGLAVLALLERRRLGPRPLQARLWALLAGLFLGVDLVLWNHAIADVGAGVATVLGNLQVLFVALAAWLLFGERPGRRFFAVLPVVLIGVVLVSGLAGKTATGGHPAAGIYYGLGTSVAYGGFLLILRQAGATIQHVAGQVADASAGAAAGSLLLGLAFGGLQLAPPLHALGWLLVLALTSGTAGWLLITSSLPRLPAALSSLVLLLQPACALLLADLILGQRPTIIQVGGALLVCGGVLAGTKAPRSAQEPDSRANQLTSESLAAVTAAVTANRT